MPKPNSIDRAADRQRADRPSEGRSASTPYRDYGILACLWLGVAVIDRTWFFLDHTPPAWDQADHLTKAMHHWRVLQQPHLVSPDWWRDLWQQAQTYRAPLTYIATAPLFWLFGAGFDQATLVNLGFTAVLLLSIYQLGRALRDAQTGLWAATFCLLAPSLVVMRTDYLLDYSTAAMVTLGFTCLTQWWWAKGRRASWAWMLAAGVSLGLATLTRANAVLFFVVPIAWVVVASFGQLVSGRWRQPPQSRSIASRSPWIQILQLLGIGVIAGAVIYSWVLTNWLTIITSILASNRWGAEYQSDPARRGWLGWLYYARIIPDMLSMPLVVTAVGCWLLAALQRVRPISRWLRGGGADRTEAQAGPALGSPPALPGSETRAKYLWCIAYCLGTYALYSWTPNKEYRFVLPYVPVLVLLLVSGLTYWPGTGFRWLRYGTAIVASWGVIATLFPLPMALSPLRRLPYLGATYPHAQVIAAVIQQQPYQRSTIGLVANTAEVNPMNVDFYGAVAQFQVYGRQLAFSESTAAQDSRGVDWYLTKTGDQGAYNTIEAGQQALKTLVESSPSLDLHHTWPLPDASELRLYHRRQPPITVTPLDRQLDRVTLQAVTLPDRGAPGRAIPVGYDLAGPWQALRDGLLVLTWQCQPTQGLPCSGDRDRWFHDHGVGLGQIYAGREQPQDTAGFQVSEQLAMEPPSQIPSGRYQLRATYLNRQTDQAYALAIPEVAITLVPQTDPQPAPDPDLITQFRNLSALLPEGQLDPIFNTIGRINQYDPIQDYMAQLESTLAYRLQADPDRTDLLYTQGLVYALQRRPDPAIATFTRLTTLSADNPWAWLYLGVVRLYNFQPRFAQAAFDRASQLQPTIPELKTLRIAAAALQFDLMTVHRLLTYSSSAP